MLLTHDELYHKFESFKAEAEVTLDAKPLFTKVWGSYSHNCQVESSDLDFLAIYQVPTGVIVGLYDYPQTIECKREKGAPHDMEAHEIGKFCQLLLKGAPAMLEVLYTEHWFNAHGAAFNKLREERHRFLSKRAVDQYLGYAEGQIKRFRGNRSLHSKGGEATEKWAYHFVRLVTDAGRIAAGGGPVVWKEDKERDTLMRIRRNEADIEDIIANAEIVIAALRVGREHWAVQDEPDKTWLNDWLVRLRLGLI